MLPRYSHTKAAMENDPEYVDMVREAFLAEDEPKGDAEAKPQGPPLHEWSAVRDGISDMIEELRLLRESQIAAAGGKPGKIEPAPRPETALTIMSRSARIEKRKAAHDNLVGRLLPNRK